LAGDDQLITDFRLSLAVLGT